MPVHRDRPADAAVPVTWLGPAGRDGAPDGAPDGVPVAFLHGLFATNAMWRTPGLGALVSRRPAVALPLPGHHPWHLPPADLAGLLRDDRLATAYAEALRRTFGGRPVRLVGHSTGALVALEIARLHPDLVAGVCIVGALRSGRLPGCRSLVRELACLPALGPAAFRLMLGAWLATPRTFSAGLRSAMASAGPLEAIPGAVLHDLRQSDPRSLHAMALWLRRWPGLAAPDTVDAPVFSVICAGDPVVHPMQQLALARALRRGRAVVLPSGHLPMIEQPAAFCDALGRWLDAPAVRFAVGRTADGRIGTALSSATVAT
jgi:pimeloyl-ACP methyl ester carboxylesterase